MMVGEQTWQAATRVKHEQASTVKLWMPTRLFHFLHAMFLLSEEFPAFSFSRSYAQA